jgi:hypothetical protein
MTDVFIVPSMASYALSVVSSEALGGATWT